MNDVTSSHLRVGPSRYSQGGLVVFNRYRSSGSTAIEIVDAETGESQTTATVNLGPLYEGKVWLKGWSENEGVPEALEAAGVLTRTGVRHPCGFAEAEEAELTEAALESMRRQLDGE